ncbi:ester hydrolase C11orf54 homolog isoform X2 [Lineus longissimus]
MLAAPGLCGSPCLADIGGVPYLIPTVQKDKYYNLEKIASEMELPAGFLLGAGAGPHRSVGVNCEMMANIKASEDKSQVVNKTHLASVNPEDNSCILEKADVSDCALMANLFGSEGKPGKVLQVKAKKRTGPTNFVTCMRETLGDHYGEKAVGIGGAFVIQTGKAKLHIMPKFSCAPLKTEEDVNSWLNFYDMPAPLVCVGQLTSHDPDLDLRVEHFHCFSDHGVGGHYHYDVTPDEVEYLGYFNVGEYMYRMDRPTVTHQVGRD